MQQIADLTQKIDQTNDAMSTRMGGYYGDRKKNDESQLGKLTKDRYVKENQYRLLLFFDIIG